MVLPLAFISPCWLCFVPLCPLSTPFYLLGNLLAGTGSVHLGPRLLVNWPPLPQLSPQPLPPPIPRTPITQRLTKTTSGTIRRLLSGTVIIYFLESPWTINQVGFFCPKSCPDVSEAGNYQIQYVQPILEDSPPPLSSLPPYPPYRLAGVKLILLRLLGKMVQVQIHQLFFTIWRHNH